ncbi:MAG TPA: Ig-like domain-containing protein, partial [Cellulomonas sp.]|nr:Ig-like domain-containing protein [Cellulomonas sp.]
IDNTLPVTAQDDPGQYLHNTITLTGTAADPNDPQGVAGSGVDHVDFQISPAGAGTWTTVGTDTTEPYTASFDTTTLADGHYDFRTVAYDVAGNQTNATSVDNRLIDNTVPVAQIVDPGANLHATVNLATDPAGTNDPGGANASGIVATTFETSGDGGATWQPASASWNTTGVADGLYDIRVTVRDAAGNDSSPSVVSSRRVDNTKPVTSASGVPSGFASSDVTVTLNPNDAGSGVTDTLYQVDGGAVQHGTSVLIPAPSNGSNDGSHTISFQSVDAAGNIEGQHSVSVQIDATPPACPTCSASDYVSGTVSLTATPSDSGAGIASVAFQYSADGTTGWTTIGTDSTGTAGVYSTPWNTTTPGDGAWHLRARITDAATNVSTIDLHPGGAGVVVVDNTAPSAAVGAPSAGIFVSGTNVTISATSGDANALTYAFLVNGSVIASGSSTSITWDSTTVADGPVQLTVRATDPAGNATTSAPVTVTVDNQSPTPTLNDPGAAIAGSPTISATTDADTVTVEFQQRAQGSGTWVSIATPGPPFQQTFATGGLTDGTYELRAIATDGSGHTGTSAIRSVVVDNTLPTGSVVQPNAGNTIGGPSSQLHATASDPSGSGVQSVEFQYTLSGTNVWTSIATVTGTPYNATWDATAVPTNDYDLRIRVTDNAGNVRTATPITVHVDSTAPTVTFTSPGANLSGTISLTATSAGPDAVSVSFEESPAGANTWQTISTDNASPWTVSFDTHTVGDGLYDIRAKAVDALGNVGTSVRTGIRIDNTAPSLTTTAPVDASTVASATAIVLDASEIVTLSGVTLDGLPTVAP